jgi:hypothetical protein
METRRKTSNSTRAQKNRFAVYFLIFFFIGLLSAPNMVHADTTSNLFGWWKFDEGTGTTAADSSANANTGTLAGGTPPTWTVGRIGSNALTFNANGGSGGNYVTTVKNNTNGADQTFAAWIYATTLNTHNLILSGDNTAMWFEVLANGHLTFHDRANVDREYTGATLSTGQWYHVAATCQVAAGRVTMYIDGSQVYQQSTPAACTTNFTQKYMIGSLGFSAGNIGWTGKLDDVRMYERELSSSDIGELYALGVAITSPSVTTSAPTLVATSTLTLNAVITATGGENATQSGFAYGTSSDLSIVIATSTLGSQTGTSSFSQNLSGLTPNTTYYFRAYATNSGGTGFGSILSTTTLPISAPTVTTQAVSSIAATTATGNGTITSTGNINPTVRGFVYGTTSGYGATTTSSGSFSTGAFTGSITGLTCGTLYHVAAYATNSQGTGYGSDVTMTTSDCVDTTPPTITNVTSDKANSTYGVGEIIDIDVTFSEAVTSTGNVTVTLETGATDRTCTFTVSNAMTGTCNYTVQSGDTSSDLTVNSISGTIVDQSDNAMSNFTPATNLAANKAIVIDTTAPGISGIASSTTQTTATITWTTDEVATSSVQYGLTSSYGNASSSAVSTTSHSIRLSGLTASTTYHFKIFGGDAVSNVGTSTDLIFTTSPVPDGPTLCNGETCVTLEDGDVINIIGDSLTSINMYSSYLESYFHLRYPDINLHFRVIARSGGSICHYITTTNGTDGCTTTERRYESQGYSTSPSYNILMMAANGSYASTTYISQVDNLVTNHYLTSTSTPILFDAPPRDDADGSPLLSQYSAKIQAYAEANGYVYTNVWDDIHAIFLSNQASSSPVDLEVGSDIEHMGPPGHLVWTYAYLSQLGVEDDVSSASIDASDATLVSASHAAISNIVTTASGVDFTRLDDRLPMAYDSEADPALAIIPGLYDLNKYMLTVSGLSAGDYYVYVDGVASGVVSSSELATGWNMSKMKNGPIHDQTMGVLDRIRDKEGVNRYAGYGTWTTRSNISPNSGMINYISNATANFNGGAVTGEALKASLSSVLANMDSLDNSIYASSTPISRNFSLVKVTGSPDIVAPVRSSGSPSSTISAGTTSTTVSLTTDNNATCRYSVTQYVPYRYMTAFTSTGGTSHSSLISGLVNGVNYRYYVRCLDEFANVNTDDYLIAFQVSPGSQLPFAYWKFDESSAGTMADSSGNGFNATAGSGTTATTTVKLGAYALAFNGTTGVVSAPDLTKADNVGVLTATAWVKGPGNFAAGNAYNVITKHTSGQGAWLLYYSGPSQAYVCLMRNTLGTSVTALGPTILRSDVNWHNVVCVYDGANVTVYTDGVPGSGANSPALTGLIQNTTYPVCIGGQSNGTTCITSSLFSGIIDDVRLYEKALTVNEVQALYATAPTAYSIASSTTSTTAAITWTTIDIATSSVNYGLTTSYGSSAFSDVATTSHTINLSSLSPNTAYHFKVVSRNYGTGIATSSEDYTFTTSAAADITPPVISAGLPSGTLSAGTTGTSLQVSTDENATCKYGTVASTAYASIAGTFSVTGTTTHSQAISGLSNGTSYSYYVRCIDSATNANVSDYTVSFSVDSAPDTTPPTVSVTAPAASATVSGSAVTVSANASDGVGVVGVQFKYNTSNNIGAEDTASAYSVNWDTRALPDGSYTLIAVARDAAGNYATSSAVAVTVSNVVPDTTPPSLSSIASSTTDTTATITWNTLGETSTSTVRYGTTSSYGSATSSSNFVNNHSISISSLSPSTAYHFQVSSADASGNVSTSSDLVFTTTADTTPPVLSSGSPSGALAAGTSATTLQVSTDENATCRYGTVASTAYASIADTFSTTGTMAHSQAISGLSDGTSYSYYVRCIDSATNANISDYTVSFSVASPSSGGGGGSSGGGGGYSGGGSFTIIYNNVATTTPILAAAVPCRVGDVFSTQTGQRCTSWPQTSSGTPSSFAFSQNLQFGMNNSDVRRLQIFLNARGFVIAASGAGSPGNETTYFGSATRAALARFQAANRISPAVGYFGPTTRAFVNGSSATPLTPIVPQQIQNPVLQLGSTGPAVKLLRQKLRAAGYFAPYGSAVDVPASAAVETDHFGPSTETVVKKYQCDKKIICSGTAATTGWGIVGPRTWASINL